jgi:hypothetical protein
MKSKPGPIIMHQNRRRMYRNVKTRCANEFAFVNGLDFKNSARVMECVVSDSRIMKSKPSPIIMHQTRRRM